MNQVPLFFTAATGFFNGLSGSSQPVSIPWVNSFDSIPGGASICVLTTNTGIFIPGIYVLLPDLSGNNPPSWKLSLQMSDLSAAQAINATLSIVLNSTGSTTFAAPIKVFSDAGLVTSGIVAVDPSGGAFVIVTPPVTQLSSYIVSALPSAATAGSGSRAFVTDATTPTFGATVVGAGAVKVPVYSDGTNWKVG